VSTGKPISGRTTLIPHIGYPTETFKAPLIYNPWFAAHGIDTIVVPMACTADDYDALLKPLFRVRNVIGALITMPHKVSTLRLLDARSVAVEIAGSCNAIRKREDGTLEGDMFDGAGYVRGATRKGFNFPGKRVLVVGAGGVGSAIAASIAAEGPAMLTVTDIDREAASSLADRLQRHYRSLEVRVGSSDPTGYDMVVNATPLGMKPGDPLPFDVARLSPRTFVGEVVMKQEMTPLLQAATQRGCPYQVGTDMLFEQIPAYLEFFGFPSTTPEELRGVAKVAY